MEASVQKMKDLFPFASKVLKMMPAADIRNRLDYSPNDIKWLASETGVFTSASDLDRIHQEWVDLQLEEFAFDSTPTPSSFSPAKFWDGKALQHYEKVTTLMRALLCIPHSNASSERVFSMLKKIYTDQRTDLCSETINALLSVKLNIDTCCFNTDIPTEMLKALKKASKTYNDKHLKKDEGNASATPDIISID